LTHTIKYDPKNHKSCIGELQEAISGREKQRKSMNDTIDIYWKVPMLGEYVSNQISQFNRIFPKIAFVYTKLYKNDSPIFTRTQKT